MHHIDSIVNSLLAFGEFLERHTNAAYIIATVITGISVGYGLSYYPLALHAGFLAYLYFSHR